MPRVTIKTGIVAADGHEAVLTEYLCDWPACPHVAVHLIPAAPGLRVLTIVCPEHAALTRAKPTTRRDRVREPASRASRAAHRLSNTARSAAVIAMTRPARFFVVPTSSRTSPAARSTFRHRRLKTSPLRQPVS